MTKQGNSGERGTPKIQITDHGTTNFPLNPREGDEFHDTGSQTWFTFKQGQWIITEW